MLIDFGIETLACFNARETSLEPFPGRDKRVERKDANTNGTICMMQGIEASDAASKGPTDEVANQHNEPK